MCVCAHLLQEHEKQVLRIKAIKASWTDGLPLSHRIPMPSSFSWSRKILYEGFPSKLQTHGNAPILSVLLYAHNIDILTSLPNYLSVSSILVKGVVSGSLGKAVKIVLLIITEYRLFKERFLINDKHSKLI